MEDSAPLRVLRPDTGTEEDEEVPEEPGDVVEGHAEEHVDVDGVPGTLESGECQQYCQRCHQEDGGYCQTCFNEYFMRIGLSLA